MRRPTAQPKPPTIDDFQRLHRGVSRITFRKFKSILNNQAGACAVYSREKWPIFQDMPLQFFSSFNSGDTTQVLLDLAWKLGEKP